MIEKFLKAKHWQIFILAFGMYIVYNLKMIFDFFENNHNPEEDFILVTKLFPFMTIVLFLVIFGWMWSVSIGLNKKIPQGVKMKVKKFKILFFIPLIYMLILIFYIGNVLNGLIQLEGSSTGYRAGFWVFLILPLHLFSIFCVLYSIYFTAKTIKTVELQKEVSFSEFIGEFIMVWFLIFGIWVLQPKINKMVEGG